MASFGSDSGGHYSTSNLLKLHYHCFISRLFCSVLITFWTTLEANTAQNDLQAVHQLALPEAGKVWPALGVTLEDISPLQTC